MVSQKFITKNERETKNAGRAIIETLQVKSLRLVALYGDLGVGKTTLVQGMAEALGIKNRLISPTFILIKEYSVNHYRGNIRQCVSKVERFYHIDLYRLENYEEIKSLGLTEIFSDDKGVVAIEWAEKAKNLLPEKRLEVVFESLGGDRRIIEVSTNQSKTLV